MKTVRFVIPVSVKTSVVVMALLFMVPLGLSACGMASNTLETDREAHLEKQDVRDAFAARLPEIEEKSGGAKIPALQPYVASRTDKVRSMPLVSISVNQSVPLRDVFFELAQQAGYDIELDPRIVGSVIFTARERPLDQVIERLANIAGLRYEFKDDFLRVELDTPYNHTYKINYLSYVRSNTSSIRNDVAVVSGEGATDTGSDFESTATSEIDFWGELEANLTQILAKRVSAMRTSSDPRITALESEARVVPVGAAQAGGKSYIAPPSSVLRVESLPVDADRSDEDAEDRLMPPSTFVVNRQAGLISVFATQKAHKDVEKYLKLLEKSVTSQVLIEAKILEVSLTDQFSMGIDWSSTLFSDELTIGQSSGPNFANNALTRLGAGNAAFVAGYVGNDISALIDALSTYGSVRALASPRMTVLNNQSAVLNVATNKIFFELDVETLTETDQPTQTTVDSTIRNVPVGILVNVQPSIDLENNTVSLAVRPTVTRVDDEIADPAVAFAAADAGIDIESLIPQLNVRELDSVIQVRSGQPIVMGGLLEDSVSTDENGIPVLSEVPIMGALFRQHTDTVQKTELVIFLKATILDNPSSTIHNTDRDMYRRFSSDRRPFKI